MLVINIHQPNLFIHIIYSILYFNFRSDWKKFLKVNLICFSSWSMWVEESSLIGKIFWKGFLGIHVGFRKNPTITRLCLNRFLFMSKPFFWNTSMVFTLKQTAKASFFREIQIEDVLHPFLTTSFSLFWNTIRI